MFEGAPKLGQPASKEKTPQRQSEHAETSGQKEAKEFFNERIRQLEYQLEGVINSSETEEKIIRELDALKTARDFDFNINSIKDALRNKSQGNVRELKHALKLLTNGTHEQTVSREAA